MSELEKYAYIRCRECGRDNRLMIDTQKTGHYQCGSCNSHLMFYGTEKQSKYKNWIWAAIIGIPFAFIGYQNYPDENNWTNKKIQTYEKVCKSKYAQDTIWPSKRIESHCECIVKRITRYKYEYYVNLPKETKSRLNSYCLWN